MDHIINNQVHQLPRVNGHPINLYEDNSAAFTCLFLNGLHTARDPPISFTDYIQSRLLNVDNRWSNISRQFSSIVIFGEV